MIKIERNGHSFRVDIEGYEDFWRRFERGSWEPETISVFDQYIDKSTTYVDIGAWVGPTLFYAAEIAGKCFAVEADPIAFKRLERNLFLNESEDWYSNIELINKEISDQVGQINFGSQGQGGDSMSSILWGDHSTSWLVETIGPKQLTDKVRETASRFFIKIDIEGGEFTMLRSLKDIFNFDDAIVLLSLHNIYLKRALKAKYEGMNFFYRFFKMRSEFIEVYRELFSNLPANKICTVNGRKLDRSLWLFVHIWIFCQPPKEKQFRDILMVPRV